MLWLIADEPLRAQSTPLMVTASPKYVFEGRGVCTTVRVPRHPDNRLLRLMIDGQQFGASSEFQLDGADAPIVHERFWPNLPYGKYRVLAIVQRMDGTSREAADHFLVVTGDR